jgi:putative ABC transport system permease protein
MSSFALAWRTARRYKARALLAVAGVAIIGALNFDMLLLSRGLLLSFADLIGRTGFDVRVVSGSGLADRVPIEGAGALAAEIRRLPEVEAVAVLRRGSAMVGADGRPASFASLLATNDPSGAGAWSLLRGSSLDGDRAAAAPPLVVSRALSASLRLEPGSTVRLHAHLPGRSSALPPADFRVAGIAEFRFESFDSAVAATTLEGFRYAYGGLADDEAEMLLVASKPEAGAGRALPAIARLRPDLRAFSNEQVIAEFNRNGFAYFRQISAVLSATASAFTFLLVATLLTVSVNQRLAEVAALRALGISRRRVAGTLLWESALLVGLGGLLAVPLGFALSQAFDHILRRMPGLPEALHFFVFDWRALASHLLLLAGTAVVAAFYPMWLAVKLPIAQTLRQEVVS